MPADAIRFLMGIESECLTFVDRKGGEGRLEPAVRKFFAALASSAPSLPTSSPTVPGPMGLFHPYGKVYVDGGHIELASAEGDSPYSLVQLVEQQRYLVARALAVARDEGFPLRLVANNHDGLLQSRASTWGMHENYLVTCSPERLIDRTLPFLVTRVFAGAGGLLYPSAEWTAGVRIHFLKGDVGGSTVLDRAIFSTSRNESLSKHHQAQRCHLILGDNLRSPFGIALTTGTTSLVLAMAEHAPELVGPIPRKLAPQQSTLWIPLIKQLGFLGSLVNPQPVHSLAIAVQRLYCSAAEKFIASRGDLPPWTKQIVADWKETLDRMETSDTDWLSRHLDPWIKQRLYADYLSKIDVVAGDVVRSRDHFARLAILDQAYHEIAISSSRDSSQSSAHSLGGGILPFVLPGTEKPAFIPDVSTRARARALLLREFDRQPNLVMDWSGLYDGSGRVVASLADPFATSPQTTVPSPN